MTQDVLRLKNDVLNELRNEKYYVQDDLRAIVDDSSMSQREKVQGVIDAVSSLVGIDAKIATVENIFQAPAAPAPEQPIAPEGEVTDTGEPTNVVEPDLNPQGQTHSE
jgi:hypothetical protein